MRSTRTKVNRSACQAHWLKIFQGKAAHQTRIFGNVCCVTTHKAKNLQGDLNVLRVVKKITRKRMAEQGQRLELVEASSWAIFSDISHCDSAPSTCEAETASL